MWWGELGGGRVKEGDMGRVRMKVGMGKTAGTFTGLLHYMPACGAKLGGNFDLFCSTGYLFHFNATKFWAAI